MPPPGATGSSRSTLVTLMSAWLSTAVLTVAVLLAWFDSSVEYAAAVLVRLPAATSLPTRAVTVTVRDAPLAKVPNWQTAPPQTPPLEALIPAKVMPAGS